MTQSGKDRDKGAETMPEDIAAMPFEQALAALEEIVSRLESASVSLEDSIDLYARGVWLKRHCENKLNAAEARIEKIALDEDGMPHAERIDIS